MHRQLPFNTTLAFVLAFWLLLTPTVAGQASITTADNSLSTDLPDSLTFSVQASSSATIKDVSLNYGFTARSCVEGGAVQQPDFVPAKAISATYTLDLRDSGSFPIGAEVWWTWDLTDESGATVTTERQTHRIEDDRYQWSSTTSGNITVFWHQGDRAFGETLAGIAQRALDRITRNAGLELNDPIQLIVYPEPSEISDVILFQPEWIGGLAFPAHNIVMAAIAPGEDAWAREVIPHELMHLVSGALTFNCLGAGMPTWLDEGLSRFSENSPNADLAAKVRDLALSGELPALSSLANAFSAYGNEAGLSYEQSYQVVAFLIDRYGPEKMSDLLADVAAGSAIDKALTHVYGYTTQTLDSAWRESFGAPTQRAIVATPLSIPTLALWTAVVPKATATMVPTATETAPAIAAVDTPTATAQAMAEPTGTRSAGGASPCVGGLGLAASFVWLGLRRRGRPVQRRQ